jgi:hypothetical protein
MAGKTPAVAVPISVTQQVKARLLLFRSSLLPPNYHGPPLTEPNTMADFSAIIDISPYRLFHSYIDKFPDDGLQVALADFREQNPSMKLSPLLYYCVQQRKLAPFEKLLEYGVSPDEDVVAASAMEKDESFLLKLLDHGWPIDHNLEKGRVPSLLW